MYVNVVFVRRGLYSAVSLTLVREQRFFKIIIIIIIIILFLISFLLSLPPPRPSILAPISGENSALNKFSHQPTVNREVDLDHHSPHHPFPCTYWTKGFCARKASLNIQWHTLVVRLVGGRVLENNNRTIGKFASEPKGYFVLTQNYSCFKNTFFF